MKKKIVYIASPYSKGDVEQNVQNQIDIASILINLGFSPIAPLLFHFIHKQYPVNYDDMCEILMEQLRRSDYVLRLPGESKGADAEVAEANRLNIPVFTSIADLANFKEDNKVRRPINVDLDINLRVIGYSMPSLTLSSDEGEGYTIISNYPEDTKCKPELKRHHFEEWVAQLKYFTKCIKNMGKSL